MSSSTADQQDEIVKVTRPHIQQTVSKDEPDKGNISLNNNDAAASTNTSQNKRPWRFCKLYKNFEAPPAGPISKQFALASCIYTIRFNHIPLVELDAPGRVQKIIKNELPSAQQDGMFGDLIQNCWKGTYVSMAEVYEDIQSRIDAGSDSKSDVFEGSHDSHHDAADLLAQCEEFLTRERARERPAIYDS